MTRAAGSSGARWGSVARRGAAELHRNEGPERKRATEVWRAPSARSRDGESWEPDRGWVRDEPGNPDGSTATAAGAISPASRPGRARSGPGGPGSAEDGGGGHRFNVPVPVVEELSDAAGPTRGSRLASRLADASHAYQRERYEEARRLLRVLAGEAPDAPAVRELNGLCLYQMGRWEPASRELEAFRRLSGSYEQHPVLADCYRALRRYHDADELWEELRSASPDPDLVAEGRIVAAGSRADRGDLRGALELLDRAARKVDHPRDRHLRQWYVLADLYERAGELPRAREMFSRVATADPDAFDVRQRLRALR